MKCIYKIVNKITEECYVGSALNFYKRKYYHIYDLKNQKHHSPILQNSWNKYGSDVFDFIVIEEIEKDDNLLIREQYWINILKPKYNISKIAGSPLGVKHTLQSRINMSNAHKGKTLKEMGHSETCNCCICDRKTGQNSPRYIKREMRECFCGCGKQFEVPLNSQKKFISGHNKPSLGKKRTKEQIESQKEKVRKKIIQLTENNDYICEWDGVVIASKKLNINVNKIIDCLKNRRESFKNFKFKYKN